MKDKLVVSKFYDYYDCAVCGGSPGAEGHVVTRNGEEIVMLTLVDHCCGGQTYAEEHLLKAVLSSYEIEANVERY